MMRLRLLGSLLGAVAIASVAACGDNSKRCGDGTEANEDGYCVPVDTTTCGPGTTLSGDECVPDGSVICEQGTVFDEEAGGCVPSDEVCAEGTVFVDGECVPEDDTLTADLEEAPEPNDAQEEDDDIAGQFVLPAAGESTSLHGCITPYRDVDGDGFDDIDYDAWVFQANGPALVEITADGVGGLTAGYIMIGLIDQPSFDGTWQRIGANLTGDTASRQVYLPAAGIYAIFMTDSRSIFFESGAAGTEETCYFTTVENLGAPPAPVAISGPNTEIAGMVDDAPLFFSYDPAEGDLLEVLHALDTTSTAAASSVLAMNNDGFWSYGEPAPFVGGLADDDEVLLVVEPVYNYALEPVPFTLEVNPLPVAALPTDGSDVTVTNTDGSFGTLDAATWAYVDVAADTMVNLDIPSDVAIHKVIVDRDLFIVSDITGFTSFFGGTPTDSFNDWVRFPGPGRYYILLWEEGADAETTYTVSSTVASAPISPITVGTPLDDAAFNALGSTWHSVDPGTLQWLALSAASDDFGGDVELQLYDFASVGVPDSDFFDVQTSTFAGDTGGRIVFGEGIDYLVRVNDADGTADETATYDVSIAARMFDNLGLVATGATVNRDDVVVAEAGSLFFVRSTPGNVITIDATPAEADIIVEALARDESVDVDADAEGAAGAEFLAIPVSSQGWAAFRVSYFGSPTDATVDLAISSLAPVPYTVAAGTTTFTDVCGDAEAEDLTPGDDDEGTTPGSLGIAFELFGLPGSGDYEVSANGFLSFLPLEGAFFSNGVIPDPASPNALIAPYWDDLWEVTVCVLEDADSATFQWTGERFLASETVEMQAILHTDGRIELVYGANHTANGASGTVGVEDVSGTVGNGIAINQPGTIQPSSSYVLTPAP